MEKNEIVKIFLDKGCVTDNASLDFFSANQTLIEPFLEYYSDLKDKPSPINLGLVQEILKIKPIGLQVLKTDRKKPKVSILDQSTFLNKRYEIVRKVMNGRLDLINLVSINKISQKSKKFSVIGIVKEKKDETNSIILEDTTGEVEVYFSENFSPEYSLILPDDILGFICTNEVGRCYFLKTVWPDIPLTREIKTAKESNKCIFVSISSDTNIHKLVEWISRSSDKEMTLFMFSEEETPKNLMEKIPIAVKKYLVVGTSVVSIYGLTFLLSNNKIFKKYQSFFNTSPEATLVSLLKRRNMNPSLDFDRSIYEDDPFILDTVPDAVAISSFGEVSISNYKGTNILTLDDFSTSNSVLFFDTKTREVIKIEIT